MKKMIKWLAVCVLYAMVGLLRCLHFLMRGWNIGRVYFYTEWKRRDFMSFPSLLKGGGFIYPVITLVGGKHISVGSHTYIKKDCTIAAWDVYRGVHYSPVISIGNGCGIGERAHITAIHHIVLADGVLLGKDVTITDNFHGHTEFLEMAQPPLQRELYSKGEVIVEKNVWIGDKVVVMPGITIGEGAIVGAGSIVTKDIPPYSVVAGNPARIIKIERDNHEK